MELPFTLSQASCSREMEWQMLPRGGSDGRWAARLYGRLSGRGTAFHSSFLEGLPLFKHASSGGLRPRSFAALARSLGQIPRSLHAHFRGQLRGTSDRCRHSKGIQSSFVHCPRMKSRHPPLFFFFSFPAALALSTSFSSCTIRHQRMVQHLSPNRHLRQPCKHCSPWLPFTTSTLARA